MTLREGPDHMSRFEIKPEDFKGSPEHQQIKKDAYVGKLLREKDAEGREMEYHCIKCGKQNFISVTTIVESLEEM